MTVYELICELCISGDADQEVLLGGGEPILRISNDADGNIYLNDYEDFTAEQRQKQ